MPTIITENLDIGVLAALKAYKIEKGMSPSAAETWAADHLAEGLARVESVSRLQGNRRDIERGTQAAFQALKLWAQSTP